MGRQRPANPATPPPAERRLLRHALNYCDIDRFRVLAPIGDAMHHLWRGFVYGTECSCCLATRLVLLVLLAGAAGYGLGAL